MEFIVYDQNVMPKGIIEIYESAIWAERFRSVGDFEIRVPIVSSIVSDLVQNNYLSLKVTDRWMILEYVHVESDESTGKRVLICRGSSLESILKRRIIWKTTKLSGNPLSQLYRIFDENIINPENQARQIPNFIFPLPSTGDPVYELLREKTLKCQFTGDTVYDAVVSFCETYGLGFKVIMTTSKQFKFELFVPVDHSASQIENEVIIFSPEFDTLVHSEWCSTNQYYKNVALVHGEGTGDERVSRTVYSEEEEPTGLNRRELYVDARDLSSRLADGTELTEEEYGDDLDYRGHEKLAENVYISAFDGQVETSIGPRYGINYSIGDYVTVINEFGFGSVAQISEYIRAFDSNGYTEYPTFAMVN